MANYVKKPEHTAIRKEAARLLVIDPETTLATNRREVEEALMLSFNINRDRALTAIAAVLRAKRRPKGGEHGDRQSAVD